MQVRGNHDSRPHPTLLAPDRLAEIDQPHLPRREHRQAVPSQRSQSPEALSVNCASSR